jgi:uncharacterized heparinase superfamily protein
MALLAVAQSMRAAVGLGRRSVKLEQLQHVPPTLRTADPSVAVEMAAGSLGLPSGLLTFGRGDLFSAALQSPAIARDVFGFAWLAHLDAARTEASEHLIRSSLIAWSRHIARGSDIAGEPAVMARRALSLLAHADAGLSTASARDFDLVMDLVQSEFQTLAREVKRMPITHARLTALIALVEYELISNQSDATLRVTEQRLAGELNRQVLGDGGHISRSPAVALDIALDLAPLRRLYLVSQRRVPDAVTGALSRLASMLHMLQLPDRALARFNGMGATPIGDLLTVLRQQIPGELPPMTMQAQDSGYVRVAAGASVLLFDAGPGPQSLPGETPFAGALSFEFGANTVSIIVNCGAGRESPAKSSMRATAAHSALVLAGASSAPLVGGRDGFVACALETGAQTSQTITASLDSYKARHAEVHHRTLTLSPDGHQLTGIDRLEAIGKRSTVLPFEVHFHLHPSVFVEPAADRKSIRLTAGDGSVWAFSADGFVPAIEASIYYAAASGPKPSLQLVLRSTTAEARLVQWQLSRLQPPLTR